VELKWKKDVYGAIKQIKEKQYMNALADYQGNLLLIGISYDKITRKHHCVIENFTCNSTRNTVYYF